MTLHELGPRARRVYQVLLDRIRSGELAPGTRLPAHTQLAASFGVAPLTLRQVLARLEAEHLVVREHGRGTFVRPVALAEAPHVLIVARDPVERAAIEQHVRGAGSRPLVAGTPAEALATLKRERPPFLAIISLDLPRPSAGLRLARGLRQRLPRLPIAVLNPTRGQRSRLEHRLPAPLLFIGEPPLDQLSDVLRAAAPAPESTAHMSEATTTGRLELLLERYVELQLAGERIAARSLLRQDGLASGLSVAELYRFVLQPAQYRVGELWQRNQISVAREHLATGVTHAVMADLAASALHAPESGIRIVVACVEGELHDIGARMVAELLELDGFTLRFLGADVPTKSLLTIIREESARIVILSAAMPERLVELRAAVTHVRRIYGAEIRIFVGGQVMDCTSQAVRALQVDLAAGDALETVAAARRLLPDASRSSLRTPPVR